MRDEASEIRRDATETLRQGQPWIEWFVRFGHIAKGLVYLLLGLLGLYAAIGTASGLTVSTEAALRLIADAVWGQVVLAVVALGLLGYVTWRFMEGLLDVNHKGHDLAGLVKRGLYLLSGLGYGLLTLAVIRMIFGLGLAKEASSLEEHWAARLITLPAGRWLLAAIAVFLFGLAIDALYLVVSGIFRDKFKLGEMKRREQGWTILLGRIGLTARGLVIALIGFLLLRAAWLGAPKKVGGLDEAISLIQGLPFGAWLLGILFAGLFLYGVYAMLEGRYRKVRL